MKRVRLALFDFDNTIAKGDSIVSFLLYAVRSGKAPVGKLFSGVLGYLRQRVRKSSSTASSSVYKEGALSFLTRFSREERSRFCQEYIRKVLLPRVYPEALREMRACREEGLLVVVVSASVSLYMEELLPFLPADAMLSTPARLAPDGRYTGKLGANCKGPEKVIRVRNYLAENQLEADWEHSRGYGDSFSDHDMLDLTASRTLINPGQELRSRYPEARVLRWKTQKR